MKELFNPKRFYIFFRLVFILTSAFLVTTSISFAQPSQRSKRTDANQLDKKAWLEADFIQLPDRDQTSRILMPFVLDKGRLGFERMAEGDRYVAEFDLILSLYRVSDSKRVADRDLKAENRILEETKSYRILISEEERSSQLSSEYYDYFEISLSEEEIQGPLIAIVEKIEPGGDPQQIRIPLTNNLTASTQVVTLRQGAKVDSLVLLNQGNQVTYGEDFDLLILFRPEKILEITQNTEEDIEPLVNLKISSKNSLNTYFYHDQPLNLFSAIESSSDDRSAIRLSILPVTNSNNQSWGYLLIDVPGLSLANETIEVLISPSDSVNQNQVEIGITHTIQSLWPQIPSSLLRLDLALDRLSFILSESQVSEMKKGNREERTRAFYTYWTPRDPTPDTHYNELMVEYYKRIDRANQRFSTPSNSGIESDQGKQFIRLGEPDKIERLFPANSPSLELWFYPSFMLTFEATSGFGDYKLIERKAL